MHPRARKGRFWLHSDDSSQAVLSLVVTIIADTPVHVPADMPNLEACVFQPSQ
jgi:hypothetical protein